LKEPALATQFWDKIASKYAAQQIDDVPAYNETLDRVRALLSPDDTILEVGCGTGTTALILAEHVRLYTATDISEGMLGFARAKLAESPRANVSFIQSAADAKVSGAPFDGIIASSLLHLVPDLPKTLWVLHDLLRPGGLLITKTSCLAEMSPFVRVMIPLMRLFGKAPYVNFLSRETLGAAIEAAGFEVLEVRTFGTSRFIPFILARRK